MLLVFSRCPNAGQLAFDRNDTGEAYQFSYQWTDAGMAVNDVAFSLDKAKVDALPLTQPNFRPELAQRYITVELLKLARTYDPRTARIDVRQQKDQVLINVRSRSEDTAKQVLNVFEEAREDAYSQYLQEHYFTRYITPMNQKAVKPDHSRYVTENIDALIPLSQAFYDKVSKYSDAREYLNLLLSWVQSIPYDTLEDRSESNGSGFAPPFELLSKNRGDCDSKTVLTAALARAFLPTTDMAIVFLREHALLAIALPPLAGETTINAAGITYVLLEPTGPALFPFGKVADESLRDISNMQYTIELIPKTST